MPVNPTSVVRATFTVNMNKNSLGDEIANVNLFTTISHTYFKILKKRTYFV